MCITVISTVHPEYTLVLASNRDVNFSHKINYLMEANLPGISQPSDRASLLVAST